MNKVISTKSLLAAAAVMLGLTVPALAQTTVAAPEPEPVRSSGGLLGQTYANVSYGFIDLDDTDVDGHSFTLAFNQSVGTNLDSMFEYDYSRSDRIAGSRLTQHALLIGARAYTNYNGVKPFAEGHVGWAWQKFGGSRDDSFVWRAAVGAEFEINPALSLSPFVRYTDFADNSSDGAWDYGVKANYWLSDRMALMGSLSRDDDQNMEYRVGVNFRY